MQPELLLKGFEPHGAVALVAVAQQVASVLLGLRLITAVAQVVVAWIGARKELKIAALQQRRPA